MNSAIFLLLMPAIIGAAEETVPAFFELVSTGSIKAGGGCICYMETFITLEPRGDSVEVSVEHPNSHFYDEKFRGVNHFEVTVPLHEFSNFFYRLDSFLEHPESSEIFTSRALKLEIYLDCGENRIDTVLCEGKPDYEINVAQGIIRDFLKTCFDYSEK